MEKIKGPLALIVMDGVGNNPNPEGNAVAQANTPTLDRLKKEYPTTAIRTCGERVGLPAGQMGNSEVGHMNIGAGRVVEQLLTRANRISKNRDFSGNLALTKLVGSLKNNQTAAAHFVGLLSTGGVHSNQEHLLALIDYSLQQGLRKIYIQAIGDGRDRPQTASLEDFEKFLNELKKIKTNYPDAEVGIASIVGRYFAMDRDSRWERTDKAYRLYTEAKGEEFSDVMTALKAKAENGPGDEFLEPISIKDKAFTRETSVEDGDALVFFNFRADRMRQIVATFLKNPLAEKYTPKRQPKLKAILTLTNYEESFSADVIFSTDKIKNHLGQILSESKKKQFRIAETEKYPHVTYFFNGGDEHIWPGEERRVIPSPRDVPTYDLKPEMSAYEVTETLIKHLKKTPTDVVILNFANCDMVGHTGKLEAAIKAVETVDACLGKVLAVLKELGGEAIVTADHGNSEQMIDYVTGKPHTYHTTFDVPLIVVSERFKNAKLRTGGALCDISPTICEMLSIPQPAEMTGESLIEK
jgi:2,3-bisphosphoglycerate-independent phosphoglycerate mutase